MMFTSANQINLAGPESITDANEYITMASFNLMVGKKAIETSDFSLAHKLFSSGIKFLPQQNWRYHYDVSLELYECAARAALATISLDKIPLLSETVLKHARCFDDELNIHLITMMSLLHTSKLNEALEMGLDILSQLGEDISRNLTDDDFRQEVKRTQTMIAGVTENAILGYRRMINKRKQAAMEVLAFLQKCSFFAAPKICRFIILRMVQLTFTHGKNIVWRAILHCNTCSCFFRIVRSFKSVTDLPCLIWCSAQQNGQCPCRPPIFSAGNDSLKQAQVKGLRR
jgi:predicted ATPase